MINERVADLHRALKNTCLQQRRLATRQSPDHFRATLVQLIKDASDHELENLAIDIEMEEYS